LPDPELQLHQVRASESKVIVRLKEKPSCKVIVCDYSWDHIVNQIGMFAYTGLEVRARPRFPLVLAISCYFFWFQAKHVAVLEKKWHIFCTKNGRFSMAGVNLNNASYIANAMKDALASEGPSAV
jgi:aspartate/tyrosine/aromatic aminotransferase